MNSPELTNEEAQVFQKFANRMFELIEISFPDQPAFIPLEYHGNANPKFINQIIFQRIPREGTEEANAVLPHSQPQDPPGV
jgi:hypothetical protein